MVVTIHDCVTINCTQKPTNTFFLIWKYSSFSAEMDWHLLNLKVFDKSIYGGLLYVHSLIKASQTPNEIKW